MKKILMLSLLSASFLFADKVYKCKMTHFNQLVPLSERQILSIGDEAFLEFSYDDINMEAEVAGEDITLRYATTDIFGFDIYVSEEGTDAIGVAYPIRGKDEMPGVYLESASPEGNLKFWYKCK